MVTGGDRCGYLSKGAGPEHKDQSRHPVTSNAFRMLRNSLRSHNVTKRYTMLVTDTPLDRRRAKGTELDWATATTYWATAAARQSCQVREAYVTERHARHWC